MDHPLGSPTRLKMELCSGSVAGPRTKPSSHNPTYPFTQEGLACWKRWRSDGNSEDRRAQLSGPAWAQRRNVPRARTLTVRSCSNPRLW